MREMPRAWRWGFKPSSAKAGSADMGQALTVAPRKIQLDDYLSFEAEGAFRPLVSGDGARAYYRVGYYHGAMDLIQNLVQGCGELVSAMPALFLGRHYLELSMKDVLAAAGAFDIERSGRRIGHDLRTLLSETSKFLEAYDGDYAVRLGRLMPSTRGKDHPSSHSPIC